MNHFLAVNPFVRRNAIGIGIGNSDVSIATAVRKWSIRILMATTNVPLPFQESRLIE